MALPELPGPLSVLGNPPLNFRFDVLFMDLFGPYPNPLDMLFQKVSGLGSSVETATVNEGGQNLYTQLLPKRIKYENLVLQRGLFVGSYVGLEFNKAMTHFEFSPSNVLVTLLDNTRIPMAAWLFKRAFPVKWSVSELDADANAVVIEHLELSYQNMLVMRI